MLSWLGPPLTALRYVMYFRGFVDDVMFSYNADMARHVYSYAIEHDKHNSRDFNQILLKRAQVERNAGEVCCLRLPGYLLSFNYCFINKYTETIEEIFFSCFRIETANLRCSLLDKRLFD